jgi:hypothetical protein
MSQIWDFPFRRLLRLAGLRWRCSTPPPHGWSSWLSRSNPLSTSCGLDIEHLLSRLYLPLQQFGCLGNLTVNSIRCHGSMRSVCRHCVAMDLSFSGPVYSENRCVGSAQIRTRPLSSNFYIWSTDKSVTILYKEHNSSCYYEEIPSVCNNFNPTLCK